jgi:hypothetical protein
MRNLRSLLTRESPEQTAAKPSLRPDPITLQASGNSFDLVARLVGGGRAVHPVSRVFRGAFHGLRVTGRLASSTRFRIPRCESARSNTRTPPLLRIITYKNAPLGDEPGGALRLILFVYQCLKRNSFTISSCAALSWLGLPSSTANTYQPAPWGAAHAAASTSVRCSCRQRR